MVDDLSGAMLSLNSDVLLFDDDDAPDSKNVE